MNIISLTGFMGCGKSSIGSLLSSLLQAEFIDLDLYIENRTCRTIPEIFKTDSEAGFRAIEAACLEEVISEQKNRPGVTVLSLGGGTLTTEECAEAVHNETFCVYLRACVDTLVNNLAEDWAGRPMLSGAADGAKKTESIAALRQRISDLMSQRSTTYESTAHLIVDIDGLSFKEVAEEISKAISY